MASQTYDFVKLKIEPSSNGKGASVFLDNIDVSMSVRRLNLDIDAERWGTSEFAIATIELFVVPSVGELNIINMPPDPLG